MEQIFGKGVSKGVAAGPISFYRRPSGEIPRRSVTDSAAELVRFHDACETAKEQLGVLHDKALTEAGEDAAMLFEAHQMMLDDGDYLALVEARVKAALGKNFSVYRSDPFFLEILPRNIDKAQSLAQLLKLLGMEREEMIACGDGYNDLSMIEFAGLGVAMENAVRPVRSSADYVTFSNNDDGVAHVVEKFLLYTDRDFLN